MAPRFPVAWEDEEDSSISWRRDPGFPDPLGALSACLLDDAAEQLDACARCCGLPFTLRVRRINTYVYSATVPTGGDGHRRGAVEAVPDGERHLAFWEAFDVRGAGLVALQAHLDETLRRFRRIWEVRFLATLPRADDLGVAAKPLSALRLLEADDPATGVESDLWIEFRAVLHVRRVVAEFGRRFESAGVLDRADDVLQLTTQELRALPRGGDRRAEVAARRAELEFFRGVVPPERLEPHERVPRMTV